MARPARTALIALFATPFWIPQAMAEDNLMTIASPWDGEKLAAGQTYKLEYEVKGAAKAHHVHVYVDGAEVATGHKLKGDFALGPFKVGERKICVAPVNGNHTAVATRSRITVTVQ